MKRNIHSTKIKKLFNEYGVYAALLLFVVFAALFYDKFFSYTNITNLFKQNCAKGIVAIGMTIVILAGGIDLSVGSCVALSGILTASLSDSGTLLMILLPILVGVAIGIINGFCVAKLKIAPFIVTLALQMASRGIVYIISNEHTISFAERGKALSSLVNSSPLGIPVQAIFLIAAFLIAGWVLRYTSFGRSIYAVGGNQDAANYMGLPTVRVKFLTYVISGFCAALAGVLLSARLSSGQPYVANEWQMDAIAAVAIGGTSLAGGYGKLSGTFAGVLIIGLISNIINLQGTLSSWWQNIINGAILLGVVIIQTQAAKHKQEA